MQDNWFIPPLQPAYARYCPEPMQSNCIGEAQRDVLGLMTTYTCMALGLVAAIIGCRAFGGGRKAGGCSERSTGRRWIRCFLRSGRESRRERYLEPRSAPRGGRAWPR